MTPEIRLGDFWPHIIMASIAAPKRERRFPLSAKLQEEWAAIYGETWWVEMERPREVCVSGGFYLGRPK